MAEEALLRVDHVSKTFEERKNRVYAVQDVSLTIQKGECLGILGESGCGKSTLGRLLIGYYPPSSGKIYLEGRELTGMSAKERKPLRRDIQMIFQNPISSFSPRMTIGDYLWEPLRNYEHLSRGQALPRIRESLESVGLTETMMSRYSHELSGGQLQRIAIARAFIIHPKLIVCDEATSALDVSIQHQVAELLRRLQAENGLSYLFIGHDIALVQYVSRRIAVMYLGQIVEILESRRLKQQVAHPYTKALLEAVYEVHGSRGEKKLLKGDPPGMQKIPEGCCFASRCPHCTERCRTHRPALRELEPGHQAACFLTEN